MLTADRVVDFLLAGKFFCAGGIYTDEQGIAAFLGGKVRTLRSWRATGKGPPFARTTRVVYDISEFVAWLNAGGNAATNDRQKAAETCTRVQIATAHRVDSGA